MWVLIWDWMMVDDEPPRPARGATLHSVGLRIRGSVSSAGSAAADRVAEVPSTGNWPIYALTGEAGNAHDVLAAYGKGRRPHREVVGAEFVLTVGSDRFQVNFDGRAADVEPGSRVTVTGSLEVVAEYEWDSFQLVDTRADWLVTDIKDLPNRDILVSLERVPPAHE